ncbi:unnamed protein product [Moneuplotes crassus]|uniref:Uncharacterized protein n=1 Tax=Euplotes crassus TaxID=5936 RepID=A0AAD1XPQ8_EUPCR|nr:unnamed protein product [Moneuplotes crassus]
MISTIIIQKELNLNKKIKQEMVWVISSESPHHWVLSKHKNIICCDCFQELQYNSTPNTEVHKHNYSHQQVFKNHHRG